MDRKAKLNQASSGDRAFVYQQAMDLAQPVGVFMDKDRESCRVTFILDPLNSKLKVVGKGNDFISASLNAKKSAQDKISLLFGDNYEEKELLVDILKQNLWIH